VLLHHPPGLVGTSSAHAMLQNGIAVVCIHQEQADVVELESLLNQFDDLRDQLLRVSQCRWPRETLRRWLEAG